MKILKKSKEVFMKAISNAKSKFKFELKKKSTPQRVSAKQPSKDIPSFYETAIVNTKFSHSQNTCFAPDRPQELPSFYDRDKIILQVRDPRWLHVYWELRDQTIQGLKRKLGDDFSRAKKVLRVYDITNVIFNGFNEVFFYQARVSENTEFAFFNFRTEGYILRYVIYIHVFFCRSKSYQNHELRNR